MRYDWRKKSFFLLIALFVSSWYTELFAAHDSNIVYGSVIRIKHRNTKRYLATGNQVYSHHGTSGQHAVYATKGKSDAQLWIVKGPHHGHRWNAHIGKVVKQGDIVRLENLKTGRNLHTHGNRSPATSQKETTTYGRHGRGNTDDNWRVHAVWEGSRGVLTNGQTCQLISINRKTALHSHGGHYFRRDGDLQEVTNFWRRDSNDWWQVELVSTPAEHNHHGLKGTWQAHRGPNLHYNMLIWIDPAQTGWDRWETGPSQYLSLYYNNKRLWTHAASRYSSHTSREPHKHCELLCGPWRDGRTHGNCSWFYIQKEGKPSETGPVKYGDKINIFSTVAGAGHKQLSGILNPAKQWWMHAHRKWGKHHPMVLISDPSHPDVKRYGTFALESVLRGVKKGETVKQYDLVQVVAYAAKHCDNKERTLWLHSWSPWVRGGFWEILANGRGKDLDDRWGRGAKGYRNFRNLLFHRFRFHQVQRKRVPGWAHSQFDRSVGVLKTKLGAAAAKAQAAFEAAKKVAAIAAKKRAEELAEKAKAETKRIQKEMEQKLSKAAEKSEEARQKAEKRLKKAQAEAEKSLQEAQKKMEEDKKQELKLAQAKFDKAKAEQEQKLQQAELLQEELQRLADLPVGFIKKGGELKYVAAGMEEDKESKRSLAVWGITKDAQLVKMTGDGTNPWMLHIPKDPTGKGLEKLESVDIGSDGTTYAVFDGKLYRYSLAGNKKSVSPGAAKSKKKKKKKKKRKKKKKKKKKKKRKKKRKKKKKKKSEDKQVEVKEKDNYEVDNTNAKDDE